MTYNVDTNHSHTILTQKHSQQKLLVRFFLKHLNLSKVKWERIRDSVKFYKKKFETLFGIIQSDEDISMNLSKINVCKYLEGIVKRKKVSMDFGICSNDITKKTYAKLY